MSFKDSAKTFGSGLLTAATVLVNAPGNIRIAEIDAEIAKLQEEKAELQNRQIPR